MNPTEVVATKDFISFFSIDGKRTVARRSLILCASPGGGKFSDIGVVYISMGSFTSTREVSISTLDQIQEWLITGYEKE
jgi:hypothetical protein